MKILMQKSDKYILLKITLIKVYLLIKIYTYLQLSKFIKSFIKILHIFIHRLIWESDLLNFRIKIFDYNLIKSLINKLSRKTYRSKLYSHLFTKLSNFLLNMKNPVPCVMKSIEKLVSVNDARDLVGVNLR